MFSLFQNQPQAFRMIFMLEIWERFGFYTVQGVLTLYFIRLLGFSDIQSYQTFGAFTALVYGMTAVGGYLGDKLLGTKRTIVLGLIILALGYLLLVLSSYFKYGVFSALALVAVGTGIFKANPSNLLAKCYAVHDPRLHAGFTLYYMAINLGSIVALLIGPIVAARFGYAYAYCLSFLGMLLGLLNYGMQRKYVRDVNNPADSMPVKLYTWGLVVLILLALTTISAYLLQHILDTRMIVLIITLLVLSYYGKCMVGESRIIQIRMMIALILMAEAIGFFTLYQQMPTSLTLFAVHNVRPELLGLSLDPQNFQALNPFWIIFLSPILANVYQTLNKHAIHVSIPHKFAAGMTCCGLSFLSLYVARFSADSAGTISAWWLVLSYFLQSTGELLVSALGVAMVAELVPQAITGFVMGVWYLTTAIAGIFGASVASYTAVPSDIHSATDALVIYTSVFARIGVVTLCCAALMWLVAKPLGCYLQSNER